MVVFGQIVVGPPGAGKTTYCTGMKMFLEALGRPCAVINLDFANDHAPYKAAIDVRDLITLEDTMEKYSLGPNGGLVYCMEYLFDHIDWLEEKISNIAASYVIFDCPGQVELYTHHSAAHDIIEYLVSKDFRLASVYLIDSFYCCEASTFISAVLVVASTMLRLGLPHVSMLSKVDLIPFYGPMPFQLDFFTELVDLSPLTRYIDSSVPDLQPIDYSDIDSDKDSEDYAIDRQPVKAKTTLREKNRAMSESLCDTLNDLGLVSFIPIDIQNKELVGKALAAVDRANGFSFAVKETYRYKKSIDESKMNSIEDLSQLPPSLTEREAKKYLSTLFQSAASNAESVYSRSLEIQEKYTQAYETKLQESRKEEADSKGSSS